MTKPSRRRAIAQIVSASAGLAASYLDRLAAQQPCSDPATAGTLIDTVPLSRSGAPVQPYGVKFGGRGLDARLFTDLSKLGPDRLIIPNAEAFVRTECPAAVAQHRGPCPICPTATSSGTWSLWEFRWQPEKPGKHSIFLRVPDEFIPQRRLDNGYYMREVSI